MPFDDAKTYRFNPFDLTKVWPHGDYPLTEVGTMTLDRNPTDYHSEIEQAAFEPSNFVPGIGASPDKMLLGRLFSYPDAHRARIGANYKQLPVNAPVSPVHSYSKDGPMRYVKVSDPVYAPNSKGGPQADSARYGESAVWHTDGDMVRTAYTLRPDDDDWGQAHTFVRQVLNDEERARLVSNIAGHLSCCSERSSTGRTSTRSSATGSSGPSAPPDDPDPTGLMNTDRVADGPDPVGAHSPPGSSERSAPALRAHSWQWR